MLKIISTKVLNNLEFQAVEGERIMISGNSGSGKTTLLQILSGLIKPDSGLITLYDNNISELSSESVAELRLTNIGYVAQECELLSYLNVIENVVISDYISAKKPNFERARNLLLQLGIGEEEKIKSHVFLADRNKEWLLPGSFIKNQSCFY